MASFDPSIISQIPDMAGNPLEAQGRAFKLADLMTQQQSNKLLLGEQKKQVEDRRKAEDILKNFKGDIGTAEGNTQLAQLYQKAGLGSQAKEAQMLGGEMHLRQLQEDKLKMEALQFAVDYVGPQALQAKQALHTQGLPAAQAIYTRALQGLPPQYQGKFPPQLPNDPQQADQLLDQAIAHSKTAEKMLSDRRADERLNISERAADRADRRLTDIEKKQAQANAGGGFSDPKVQDLEAAIASTGFSLPAGFRSKEQQLALYKGLLRKYDGLDPDDIAKLLASNAIDYKGITKATQTAAGVAGKVEFANQELEQFVPIARDASAAVSRTSFVPYNKLAQIGRANISDPDQKRLFVATQTILNAYDLLAARGGTDKDKRAENRKILETADGPEAYNAALDFIIKEGQAAARAAGVATKASAYGGIPGGKPDAKPAGKTLKYDPATGTIS